MTQAATKKPRVVPPPLPQQRTPGESGVRLIPEELTSEPLKQVLLRVDVSVQPADPSEDRHTDWDGQRAVEFVHDTHFVAGLSHDISSGGVFVATYRRVAIGTKVLLGLEMPNGQVVEVRGIVRWSREQDDGVERPGLGVEFTDVSDSALAAIAEYCRSRP